MAIRYRKLLARYYSLMIPPDSSILEVGCGSGEILRHISSRRKCGNDTSAELIQLARDTDPKTEFFVADGNTYVTDETYDYIKISDTLNIVSDVQSLLTGIKRCSHPDTKLLVNIANNLWQPIFRAASALGLRAKQKLSSWLSGHDVRNLLQLAD